MQSLCTFKIIYSHWRSSSSYLEIRNNKNYMYDFAVALLLSLYYYSVHLVNHNIYIYYILNYTHFKVLRIKHKANV